MVVGPAIAGLVVLQAAAGLWQTHVREEKDEALHGHEEPKSLSLSSRFAALEAVKLAIALVLLFSYRRWRNNEQEWKREHRRNGTEELPLSETNGTSNGLGNNHELYEPLPNGFSSIRGDARGYTLRLGSGISYLSIATISLLLATKSYFTLSIYESDVIDPLHVYLSTSIVPLLSAAVLFILFKRALSTQQWVGIVLQICGVYSAQGLLQAPQFHSDISWSFTCILIALALFSSLTFVGLEYVYNLHDRKDPHGLNIVLFASTLLIQLSLVISFKLFYTSYEDARVSTVSSISFLSLLIRAGVDLLTLLVIFYYDVVTFAVSSLFSVAMLSLYSHLLHGLLSLNDISTCAISTLGFVIFMVGRNALPLNPTLHFEKLPLAKRSSPFIFALPLFATFAYLGYYTFSFEVRHDILGTKTASSGASLDSIFADLLLLPPPPPPPPGCMREPLPSLKYYDGNRTYHEFDDVLLIVFFSHPRYDVNLDYYKEVYSEFFPNMVFVGPRNREDIGFNHSYDVVVDSYEADEDISDPTYYKMAGRMAHHMLYTVLTTPPYSNGCYNGYLWAPFDTLLNVPRLQQFDQNKTWYFSPWGEYVPNIAMNETKQLNASFHAPPARISPDPAKNLTEGFTGWWVNWWWGDPHFGIPVCLPAFRQVPLQMRELMSSRYLNGTTRFLGGSADTLYIPERLKGDFLHVLGLFLNTSCFLEIAVPTTVHLIIPENDTIQFVDHWWIWEPPFNSSFVRQIWKKGMEVDTFHTFHWGDKGSDGKWRAIPENIEDVRLLLRESAIRQNVSLGENLIVDTHTSLKQSLASTIG